MIAVKHRQLEVIKQLVNTYKVDLTARNNAGKTAQDIANKVIKDPNILETVMKILQKKSVSTKVVHNKDAIEERKQVKSEK